MRLAITVGVVVALVAAGASLALLTLPAGYWRAHLAFPPNVLDPAKALTRIVVGAGIDQRKSSLWARLQAEKPDLVILAGDTVSGNEVTADPDLRDLAAAYQLQARVPQLQALRKATPVLVIWNDRDYGTRDAGAGFPFKAKAKTLFTAFWDIPSDSPRAKRPGLYDAVIAGPPGRRVQVILLDTRWFRDALLPAEGAGEMFRPDLDPKHTLLGPEQWAWLEAELKKDAEIRLIVSPIQVIADHHDFEKWGNFPNERERLIELVGKVGAKGVILLSGDRDVGAIYRKVDGVPYPFFEMTASALEEPRRAVGSEPGPDRLGPVYTRENYGLVTIDWERRSVWLELRDAEGQTVRLASVPLAALVPRAEVQPSVLWPTWSELDPVPTAQTAPPTTVESPPATASAPLSGTTLSQPAAEIAPPQTLPPLPSEPAAAQSP